jgi:hypothetical protein
MSKITKDTTFIRSVIARKDDKIKTSFITQPYLNWYVCGNYDT